MRFLARTAQHGSSQAQNVPAGFLLINGANRECIATYYQRYNTAAIMSVRERTWTTRKGETREAWIVDFAVSGSRHTETFERRETPTLAGTSHVAVDKGIHIAPNKTPTVIEAGRKWIEACEAAELEQLTVDAYKSTQSCTSSPNSAHTSSRD